MELHNGLGESGQGRAYYTAVSNTYNIGNTNSNFVNEPYGGIHFYESIPLAPGMGGINNEDWNVKMLAPHCPITSKDLTLYNTMYGINGCIWERNRPQPIRLSTNECMMKGYCSGTNMEIN